MLKRIFLIIVFFMLTFSCKNSTDSNNSDKIAGITETDAEGNLIGDIDRDDWSEDAYDVFFGDKIWIYNYSQYMRFPCDTVTKETSNEISIKNVSNENLSVTVNVDSPFYCQPNSINLAQNAKHDLDIEFRLPYYSTQAFNKILSVNYGDADPVEMSLYGYPEDVMPEIPQSPLKQMLYPAYPNPASQSVILKFALPQATSVTLDIINEKEKLVKTLVSSQLSAGQYTVQWDLNNNSGDVVGLGIYRAEFKAGNFEVHGDILVE